MQTTKQLTLPEVSLISCQTHTAKLPKRKTNYKLKSREIQLHEAYSPSNQEISV